MFLGNPIEPGARQKSVLIALAFLAMVGFLVVGSGTPVEGIIKCPFRWLTGLSCPGCGMTRACTHALHGDLLTSLEFHPLGIPFVLGFGLTAAYHAVQAVTAKRLHVPILERNPKWVSRFWYAVLLFVLSFGGIRLVLEIAGILTPI